MMLPCQIQANTRWPGCTGLKLTGEGEVLSVFWPLISEVALRAFPLVCPPCCMSQRRKTPDTLPLSVEWLTTVPAEPFKFGATLTVGGKNICQVPWGASLRAWTHHDTAVWYVLCSQSSAVKLYPCNSSCTDLAVVCGYTQLTGVCDSCWGFLYRSKSCADSRTGWQYKVLLTQLLTL